LYIAWGNKELPTLHTRIELIQRFERIARMMILTIGWEDLQPKDIARLGSALMKIQVLTETHLEGIPREFIAQAPLS
jgi:hypothetical protein